MSQGPRCQCGHFAIFHKAKGPGERSCTKCDCADWTSPKEKRVLDA